MGATKTYARDKSTTTNSTGIDLTWEQRESDGTRAAAAAGTTAIMENYLIADADESGGVDLQDLFKIVLTPSIHPTTGVVTLAVAVTPVKGDATEGTTVNSQVVHTETMDAFQAAAGRARQA